MSEMQAGKAWEQTRPSVWKRLAGVLMAYRRYWLTPIVIGAILIGLLQIFDVGTILGDFHYFN